MSNVLVIVLLVYIVGFLLTLFLQVLAAPMVTFPLKVLRAGVWPYFWATGRPDGMRLPMD